MESKGHDCLHWYGFWGRGYCNLHYADGVEGA